MAGQVRGVGGEVIFDPMTHARFLPGVNRLDFYDAWELWGPSGLGLDTQQRRLEHVERVFRRQDQVGAPHLAPTLRLLNGSAEEATFALATARLAKGVDSQCWQSLVGTRAFWASGVGLDAYVGSLAALRAPVWVVTMVNEVVVDQVPDLADIEAFIGMCRTVHSLSLRSRVIVATADFAGLPAVAAGADTVGSGWDRGQRTFDPNSYRLDSDPGIRIPASYVTQGKLNAVLRRDTADTIERWDPHRAGAIRGGPMPPSDQAQRMHHLARLREAATEINGATSRGERVTALKQRYNEAAAAFDVLIAALPGTVRQSEKEAWCARPSAIVDGYANPEGL
ncbi:MAG: hypothetical protein WCF04_11365 [Candidatus Nanopelagicales bacterium]